MVCYFHVKLCRECSGHRGGYKYLWFCDELLNILGFNEHGISYWCNTDVLRRMLVHWFEVVRDG